VVNFPSGGETSVDTELLEPTRYRPSGKVKWFRFLALSTVSLAVAFGMAWCLHVVFNSGWYIVVVAPVISSLPVLITLAAAVGSGHCRSRLAAGILGCLTAAVLYLGHFHADIISVIGWENAHRLDILPRYINFRMQTDVHVDVVRGNRNVARGADAVRTVLNWSAFTLEFGMLTGLCVAVAVSLASRAYCEEHRKWYRREEIRCQPGIARPITEALETNTMSELAGQIDPLPGVKLPCCAVKIEYCAAGGSRGILEEPVYLTVSEHDASQRKWRPSRGLHVAKRWQVNRDALAVFIMSFNGLRRALGGAAYELDSQSISRPEPARGRAEICPVPPPYGGTILTRGHIFIETLVGLVPTVFALAACAGLIGYGVYFRGELEIQHFACIGGAVIALLGGWIWYSLNFASYLPSIYLHSVARRALKQRPNAWVEADNPDVMYVQVIPRSHWGKIMLENASDVGYLLVEKTRRVILFEGDRERWRIPAEAVISCEIEHFSPGTATDGPFRFYVAVLRAQTVAETWEAPVTQWHIYPSKRTDAVRERQAREVQAWIFDLVGTSGHS
jgi:hypothetical protein